MEYVQVTGRDESKCIFYGACGEVCPMGCFDGGDFSACGACHMCLDVCPADCIELKGGE